MGAMDLLAAPLQNLLPQAADLVRAAASSRAFERAGEAELALQLGRIAELGRLVDALLVDAVGEVMRRSEAPVREERMTSRFGCRDVTELVQKITRLAPHTATRVQRAARAVRPAVSETTGEALDAAFPSVRSAALEGVVGIDGILAITDPLQATAPRVTAAARRGAADIGVAEARGAGPDGAGPEM